jgi:hypothetical protein
MNRNLDGRKVRQIKPQKEDAIFSSVSFEFFDGRLDLLL